jgi:hypothetical protein
MLAANDIGEQFNAQPPWAGDRKRPRRQLKKG